MKSETQIVTNDPRLRAVIVNHAVEQILEMNKGTVLTHAVVISWFDLKKRDGTYYHLMGQIRKILEDKHGVFLETVIKVGYRIMESGEEINKPKGMIVKAGKKIRDAVKSANNIRINMIPENLRGETVKEIQKIANLKLLEYSGVE